MVMAGILGRLAGLDDLRKELKLRTDELLAASVEWRKATGDLAKAVREHNKTTKKLMEILQKI